MRDPEDFFFFSFKIENAEGLGKESAVVFEELKANWLLKVPLMTLLEAQKHFDMKKFISYMFTFAYLGTTDWTQGAAIKDGKKTGRWKFIHWDLEQSVFDEAVKKNNICIDLKRKNWHQESFERFMTGVKWNKETLEPKAFSELDFRHLLFYSLWFEYPGFREEFSKYVKTSLKNRLTKKRLSDRSHGYFRLANTLPMESPEILFKARNFFKIEIEK